MITVTFYGLDEAAKDYKAGTITYDGEKLTGSNTLMEGIATEPIVTLDDEEIDPSADPERFMRNLYKAYHSPYLRAMQATN